MYKSLLFLCFLLQQTHCYLYSCNPSASCGCSRNSASISRIVGGEAATSSSWGWAVSIYISPGYLCGGSILSDRWILTAAHCVDTSTASQVTIYAGSNTYFSGQARSVSSIIVHASYNPTTKENDIALLQLSRSLNMTDPNVKVVCIPSVGSSTYTASEWPAPNLYVAAIGWGRLSESGVTSNSLQQVTIQTISASNTYCQNDIYNSQLQFCAGVSGGGKDTCQGDSGGPLMMFTASNQWVLVGVTSYGVGCARWNHPGIYTRVVYYQNWIATFTSNGFTNPTSSNSANINPFSTSTVTTTTATTATTTTATTATTTSTTTANTTTVLRSNSMMIVRSEYCIIPSLLLILFKST